MAAALGISKSTVSDIAMYARNAGVDWPLAHTLSDDESHARLYPPPRPRSSKRREPEYAVLHQETRGGLSAHSGRELADQVLQHRTRRIVVAGALTERGGLQPCDHVRCRIGLVQMRDGQARERCGH